MEEIHLFIIWENALNKKNEIIKDIKQQFEIINIYEIEWNKEKFSENLSRFYGTNLPQGSGKEQHCGNGPFLLIVVKDNKPKYETRATSRGEEIVNINLFDKKTEYRELTGGGHRIHATNNLEETNHDITLLLGKNIEDFLKETTKTENIIKLKQDLLGANGWKNANEMFYALNNCVNYALLRNYETLPEEIYVNDHNDIDLICESKENCAYVLNAKKVFGEEYRVHYVTQVENRQAFFDLRYVGDNYYCEEIEKDILKNKIYQEKGFYTIDDNMYFYTLLYHALLHKKVFAGDYKKRLKEMNIEKIEIEDSDENYLKILQKWLIKNNYDITVPIDISVQFNKEKTNRLSKLELKDNIIKWYPFKPNSKILEITTETKIENNEEKYDYIIIRGISDIAYKLFNSEYELIEYAKKSLNKDGKILFCVNNKIGTKAFCGIQKNEEKMMNRSEIEELLEKTNLKFNKFYYILTDYETANVIFTDNFLPTQETISRNVTLYENDDILFRAENKMLLKLIEQDKNLLKIFANAYFVECSQEEFEDNKIKFVSFSNIRKQKYRIKTIIHEDKVYKTAFSEQSNKHIENVKNNIYLLKKLGFETLDSYENDTIISQFQKENESFDNLIIKMIKSGNVDHATKLIIRFFNEIKERLINEKTNINIFDIYQIKYKKENIEKLNFTKYGLWDLIFQNAFYINDRFFFYDQEWINEGIPIEYIFYRAIEYTGGLKEILDISEIYKYFEIENQHLELFAKLDNKLQEKTRNDQVWNMHIKTEILEEIKQKEQQKQQMLKESLQLLNEKDARIVFLEQNMETTVNLLNQKEIEVEQVKNEIQQIKNSTSWKIMETFRKLRKGE